MTSPSEALAGTFVEPRGMIRSVVARTAGRELGGLVGGVIAGGAADRQDDSSPLKKGDIAYVGVLADEVVLFKAKRGAFKPKPLDEQIASAPRAEVLAATLEKGRLAGVLELSFASGASWTFDIPKVHLKGAASIAETLSA
jgi:hypothetical protein